MPISIFPTPAGHITLSTAEDALVSLSFSPASSLCTSPHDDPLIQTIKKEIEQWFQHPNLVFTFPITPHGTPFQKKVWAALRQIPSGETRTYGELATVLKTSARAIGNACRSNPIALIIPCHRVVAKTGLGGYAGATAGKNIKIKSKLLALESRE